MCLFVLQLVEKYFGLQENMHSEESYPVEL